MASNYRLRDLSVEKFEAFLNEEFSRVTSPSGPGSSDAQNPDDTYVINENGVRGLALIFNIEEFKSGDGTDRKGSSKDVEALEISFQRLGYYVMTFKDLKASQILIAAKAAATHYPHREADSFVCVLLSHGYEIVRSAGVEGILPSIHHIIFGSDEKAVLTEAILHQFSDKNCPSLENKPRIFLIQTCRGDESDDGVRVLHPGNVSSPPQQEDVDILSIPEMPNRIGKKCAEMLKIIWKKCTGKKGKEVIMRPVILQKDFLIAYATPPGYLSWRDEVRGSWFIQELCKFLKNPEVGNTSFLTGLSSVCGEVARNHQSLTLEEQSSGKKEMPIVDSMLVKDFFIGKRTPQNP